ncbi:hypothetical protein I552_6034 [Mycobacterium xenopi 3993]|nr:hypothetical protein I552_6034 [Mycobacterium xenopi 3993]
MSTGTAGDASSNPRTGAGGQVVGVRGGLSYDIARGMRSVLLGRSRWEWCSPAERR